MMAYEILRGMREDRDINQTELGKLLNMSQHAVSRIETGKTALTEDLIRKYCILFNVSADYILGLPDLPYPKRR